MPPTKMMTSPLLNAAISKPPTQIHTTMTGGSHGSMVPTNDSTSASNSDDGGSGRLSPTDDDRHNHHTVATFHDEEAFSLGEETEEDESSVGESSRHTTGLVNKKETELVNCSKMCVVLVVSLLAALVGLFVYVYVSQEEQSMYDTSYNHVVTEIVTNSQQRTKTILENLEGVSVSLTTQANLQGMQWPFVVFPDFQVQGMISNGITGAFTLTLHPFVLQANRPAWEMYSVDNQGWLERAHLYDDKVSPRLYEPRLDRLPVNHLDTTHTEREAWNESGVTEYIWSYDEEHLERQPEDRHGIYFPVWQRAPAEDFRPTTNLNFASVDQYSGVIRSMMQTKAPMLTPSGGGDHLAQNYDGRFPIGPVGPPRSYLLKPVFDSLYNERNMVGFLSAYLGWDQFFEGALPDYELEGVLVVIDSTCQEEVMSFLISGKGTEFMADSDIHDPRFDKMRRDFNFSDYLVPRETLAAEDGPSQEELYCAYTASIYPTNAYADQYFSDFPIIYAVLVVTCFIIATLCFAMYDVLVQRRQRKLLETAAKTNAIVSSLFPSNVRDRLLEELNTDSTPNPHQKMMKPSNHDAFRGSLHRQASLKGSRHGLASFGNSSASRLGFGMEETSLGSGGLGLSPSEAIFGSKPIADLFPSTTIMFADMVGFTAWSSTREPTAVFTLLETVYHSFDTIAKRRRVFKVETVGDCYVAVCGLPIARKDHAVTMCRFASDCLCRMNELTAQLEKSLGPDTADLCLRIGLHSGPVTAGVLRGEKGRFQLFGDTMNTASRLESTGVPNRIQISSETADHLIAAGKSAWMVLREDKVHAKGKGQLTTYWLKVNVAPNGSYKNMTDDSENESVGPAEESLRSNRNLMLAAGENSRTQRLIDYNVDILARLLHKIVVHRASNPPKMATRSRRKTFCAREGPVLDEVKDILALPQFNANDFKKTIDPDSIMISPRVHQQLSMYVSRIAELYRDNPFHNFEHASHVTMSVTKLLSRIVNPNEVHNRQDKTERVAQQFHDHTFGITSDPLTHFGCVLSALIHDADHPGVGNTVLVKEESPMALRFKNKSVAEQNSVELAWETLMLPEFEDLRACIYCNEEEFARFRQIIVNIVLATDIMDKELGALRKARWEKAFSSDITFRSSGRDDPIASVNRKATIVLEHLIQASDVAHTMQHWHVYRKWNERLFHEMYKSYLEGRIETDPSQGWYKGEIGFFDFYIIPLAKKLETCGVFGVSSDEYLNYAEANRREWEAKGAEIVEEYLSQYRNN